ncbi:MAG: alanine dehydrogenase, partial [Pseudomonadota bacterium]|nr:alanine dehydrogenase [Pseudomonadota bacterium]
SHEAPYYVEHGVIHSAITNMPAAAQLTASEALSHAITPYVLMLADDKWSESLKEAINVKDGQLMIDTAQAS